MKADGSDIICMDYHETNEWHPSVNHDGMLVYSRWDYVDRNFNAAHHLWLCYPDGRDPRSYHGNYALPFGTVEGSEWVDGRGKRTFGEFNARAIPGSNRYVTTAGPHHGQAFGALVIVDMSIEDNNELSQVKRITPNVPYPEAEPGSNRSYGPYTTAWPLSEDFYFCNFKNTIVLVDRFGNHILIYQSTTEKQMRPLDPIPVKARPIPPVIPVRTYQGERLSDNVPQATILINNVYVTDAVGKLPPSFGTAQGAARIKYMRINQIFPKTTPGANGPKIGYASGTNSRMPLGIVPVEEDGSGVRSG
jgi:hypothetical protein